MSNETTTSTLDTKIHGYLNIKLNAARQQLKKVESKTEWHDRSEDEQKDKLKKNIEDLEYVVNSPLYRGQGNSSGREHEHDLFAARFYKNYGRNLTLKYLILLFLFCISTKPLYHSF